MRIKLHSIKKHVVWVSFLSNACEMSLGEICIESRQTWNSSLSCTTFCKISIDYTCLTWFMAQDGVSRVGLSVYIIFEGTFTFFLFKSEQALHKLILLIRGRRLGIFFLLMLNVPETSDDYSWSCGFGTHYNLTVPSYLLCIKSVFRN